jgi:hypothetical protein
MWKNILYTNNIFIYKLQWDTFGKQAETCRKAVEKELITVRLH